VSNLFELLAENFCIALVALGTVHCIFLVIFADDSWNHCRRGYHLMIQLADAEKCTNIGKMEGEVTIVYESVRHTIDLEDLSSENLGTGKVPK